MRYGGPTPPGFDSQQREGEGARPALEMKSLFFQAVWSVSGEAAEIEIPKFMYLRHKVVELNFQILSASSCPKFVFHCFCLKHFLTSSLILLILVNSFAS